MIRKFYPKQSEALAIYIGKANAGRIVHTGEPGTVYTLKSLAGDPVFVTKVNDDEIWLCELCDIGATNERQGQALASRAFIQERMYQVGQIQVTVRPSQVDIIPSGMFVTAENDVSREDQEPEPVEYRPMTQQELDCLAVYYNTPLVESISQDQGEYCAETIAG